MHMKKKIAALLTALLILTVTAAASAKTVLTVSGSGDVYVPADTAVVTLGVSVRDKEVVTAQQKANEQIASIRESVLALGVDAENINTNTINLYAIYDYEDDRETVRTYAADSSLAIRVTDMDAVGKVIDVAFAAGANTLSGITFSASNTDAALTEALGQAVADAKAKAEVLAAAAGLKICGITSLSEGGTYSYSNSVTDFAAEEASCSKAAAATVVQAAKIVVSATVNMAFEAE